MSRHQAGKGWRGLAGEEPMTGIFLVISTKGKKGHCGWGIMNTDMGDMSFCPCALGGNQLICHIVGFS
jgi:hypothetical protein